MKYQPREFTLNLPGKCWVNTSNYPTTTSLYFFLNLLIIISFDVIWSGILREFSNRQNKNNKMVCVRNFIFIFHILLIYICACANDRIIYVSNFFTVIRKNCNDSVTSYILEGGVRFPVDTQEFISSRYFQNCSGGPSPHCRKHVCRVSSCRMYETNIKEDCN